MSRRQMDRSSRTIADRGRSIGQTTHTPNVTVRTRDVTPERIGQPGH